MKNETEGEQSNRAHAESLLADITAAVGTAIPKRETLTEWLKSYLLRSRARGYAEASDDTDNLKALDKFLREQKVPVVSLAAL